MTAGDPAQPTAQLRASDAPVSLGENPHHLIEPIPGRADSCRSLTHLLSPHSLRLPVLPLAPEDYVGEPRGFPAHPGGDPACRRPPLLRGPRQALRGGGAAGPPARGGPGALDRAAGVVETVAVALRLPYARISETSVRNRVSNIFTKLAVADRAQAVVRAREAGLGGH